MKYLVLFAVLFVVYLLWRAQRTSERGAAAAAKPPPAQAAPALPQDMVRCPVCALHLPKPDALQGASGRLYCSHEHRAAGGN